MTGSEKRNNFIKITAFIAVFLLIFGIAVFPKSAHAASDYTKVRVRLNVGGSSLKVAVKGDYTVKEDDSIELKSGKTYKVSVVSGKIRLEGDDVKETLSSVTFVRKEAEDLSDNLLKIGSCSYLGNIRFTASGESVRAVNIIDLEHYLYGVVAAEMGNDFPLEALKAQAVSARCYAIRKIDSADSSDSYDIIGTSSDQAYNGYNATYTRVIEAVDATRGQVLVYNEEIIEAFFTATNGGQTESPGNSWGGGAEKDRNYPYLPIKDDPYDIAGCLKNTNYEQRIYVPKDPTEKRTSKGRYSNAVLNDLQEKAYEKLKEEHDLSEISDITLLAVKSLKNGEKRYPSSEDSISFVDADAKLTVRLPDESERSVKVTISLMRKSGSSYSLAHEYLNGKFRLRYVTEMKKGWYVCNRRYGHGVGLSQMGAKNMDEEGMDYKEILGFYYPETELIEMETGGDPTDKKEDPEEKPKDEPTEDPKDEPAKEPIYTVGKKYITGITVGTAAEAFLEEMNVGETVYQLYAADSEEEKKEGVVVTGDVIKDDGGKKRYAVIYGDLDGDGEIALPDLLREQKYILEMLQLENAFKEAADATKDGSVNIADLLRIQKHLLGVTQIAQ